jgi:ribonuclease HII
MVYPTYEIENQVLSSGFKYVIGVDEAGRGPGAGPVVASAVYIPNEVLPDLLGKVNDSKKMSAKRREEMYDFITKYCNYGVQDIGADIIDEINILEATKIAMKSSIEQLEYYDYILVDGTVNLTKHIVGVQTQQVVRGDALSVSIAAASIIAKVTRDRIMSELHTVFPIYGWNNNKGYLTKDHIAAIQKYGITDYHRATFNKVGK